jgi:hypothetical protein
MSSVTHLQRRRETQLENHLNQEFIEHIRDLHAQNYFQEPNEACSGQNYQEIDPDSIEYSKEQELFYKLCKNGPLMQLKALIRSQLSLIKINLPCYMGSYRGETGLILACRYSKDLIAQYLLTFRQINVNQRDCVGNNALRYAIENDMGETVINLVELGAAIDLIESYEPSGFNSFTGIRRFNLITPIRQGLIKRYMRDYLINNLASSDGGDVDRNVLNIIMDYISVS